MIKSFDLILLPKAPLLPHSPPIFMMFDQPTENVSAIMSSFLLKYEDIYLVSGRVRPDLTTDLVFWGVAFSIKLSPDINNIIVSKNIFSNFDMKKAKCSLSICLGNNVKFAGSMSSVIQAMMILACRLGQAMGSIAAYWRPAQLLTGMDYFLDTVGIYERTGIFPIMAVIDLRCDLQSIETNGLSWFSRQEIKYQSAIMERGEMVRRLVRLGHDLAVNGPIRSNIELDGLDPGERLFCVPSPCLGTVMVESKFV